MNTTRDIYKAAVADPTEAARVACDNWRSACETYKREPSLMNSEAVKVAHAKWQVALDKHAKETAAFEQWRLGRKHNKGTL